MSTSVYFPDELIRALSAAQHVAVLTGAGISAESGVPTFRDKDGLWQKFKPQELASMEGFLRNPELVWEWYQSRRHVIYSVQPNPGHYALAELEHMVPKFTLITQNIDRLHQRAGSKAVYELHGNIVDNYCVRCKKPSSYEYTDETKQTDIPRCEYCGGLIRPAVVWFGEMLPEDVLYTAEAAASDCDVFMSIGTSAEVYPAAQLPLSAKEAGAYLVEVNPQRTTLTPYVDAAIQAPSGTALPELVRQLRAYNSSAERPESSQQNGGLQ